MAINSLSPKQASLVNFLAKRDDRKIEVALLAENDLDERAAGNLKRMKVVFIADGFVELRNTKEAQEAIEVAAKMQPNHDKPETEEQGEAPKMSLADALTGLPPVIDKPAESGEDAAKKEEAKKAKADAAAAKKAEREKAKAEKTAAKAAAKEQRDKDRASKKAPKNCACGCGAQTMKRFIAGHDAKLHSKVLKIEKGTMTIADLGDAPETKAYLRTAPWMTDGMKNGPFASYFADTTIAIDEQNNGADEQSADDDISADVDDRGTKPVEESTETGSTES